MSGEAYWNHEVTDAVYDCRLGELEEPEIGAVLPEKR